MSEGQMVAPLPVAMKLPAESWSTFSVASVPEMSRSKAGARRSSSSFQLQAARRADGHGTSFRRGSRFGRPGRYNGPAGRPVPCLCGAGGQT